MRHYKSYARVFVSACLGGLVLFLSFYVLTESPPTWFDEGIITQTAINIVQHGPTEAIIVAPGTYRAGWYVSTSYPVTFPVAVSLWLFGITLVSARAVMAIFILGFVCAGYLLARKEMPAWAAVASLALVATFAPLYGNGKNVLGEVPGLMFVGLFLLCTASIEKRATTWRLFLLAGGVLGLAVVTKPIFLLLLPAVGIVLFFSRKLLTIQKIGAAIAGFAIPFVLWLWIQFGGSTLSQVLSDYTNPHSTALGNSIVTNLVGFVTQPQPLYALLLLCVWILSFAVRLYRKQPISRTEWIAGLFALFIYAAYLRTIGFYRYFFPGEMVALLYFPLAVWYLRPSFISKKAYTLCAAIVVAALFFFQGYQVFFDSWVADHYQSHRAASLEVLHALPVGKTIFLYNTPEAAIFLPKGMPFYQYLDIAKNLQEGTDEIPLLSAGVPDFVLTSSDATSIDLSHYALESTIDRYRLWYKK